MYKNIVKNNEIIKKFLPKSMKNYFYLKLKSENPDYIKLKLCELLKFLILSHHSFGDIPFNSEIDEIWHLWILQTVQYKELMDKLPGQKFIHHSSNDYNDGSCKEKSFSFKENETNKQFSYLVSYVVNFGNFTQETEKFWPMVEDLMNVLNLDLDGLNNYLRKYASNFQNKKLD